jgi:GPH family glycoside/pentoside/hexuronide:cation symporter
MIFGVFMVVTGLVSFFSTRDVPRRETPPHKFSIKSEFQAIRQNKPFRILWAVFFMQNLAIGVSATTLIYFVIFVMKVDLTLIGPMVMTAAVSATIATPFWIWIARRYGKRETYFIGMTITSVMTIPLLFITSDYLILLFIIFLLTGIGDAANQLASNAMVPDTVEVDEIKTGERREGSIFGAWAFCRKLGMASGAFLVSISLSIFGFEGGSGTDIIPSETAVFGIRVTYALLPFFLWICAIFILKKYNLDEEEFNNIKSSLKEG